MPFRPLLVLSYNNLAIVSNEETKDCWDFLSTATLGAVRPISAGHTQVEVYPKTCGKKS